MPNQEYIKGKTIFIVISRGFIIRNVLRSGGLALMKKRGWKIVAFIGVREVPEYLKKEFKDEPVSFVPFRTVNVGWLHRRLNMITNFLLFTDSTKRYLKYGNKVMIARPRYKTYIHIAFVWTIAHIPFLKSVLRYIDATFFPEHNSEIKSYFDTYNPDIVFSTSIITSADIAFMKEGKRRRIPTVSMPKGWDNVTRNFYRFVPDYMLVQNEILEERTVALQKYPKDKISVIGFPQFDWYVRPEIYTSKDEHFKKYGLNPNLPMIFFGSEGAWANRDYEVAEIIAKWVSGDELEKKCQMLVRPHFTTVKEAKFQKFKGMKNVALDESFRISEGFFDNWDPTGPETIELANTIKHCEFLVTTASTLNLDVACLDKRIINLAFGGKYRGDEDITPFLYKSNHMQWVVNTGGLVLVQDKSELKEALNNHLKGYDEQQKGREKLRTELSYKIDGNSSKRMVDVLESAMMS